MYRLILCQNYMMSPFKLYPPPPFEAVSFCITFIKQNSRNTPFCCCCCCYEVSFSVFGACSSYRRILLIFSNFSCCFDVMARFSCEQSYQHWARSLLFSFRFGTRSKSFDKYVLLSCFLQSRAAKDEMFCLLLLLRTVHKSCQPRIGYMFVPVGL